MPAGRHIPATEPGAFTPKPAQLPPPNTTGVIGWMRQNLFNSLLNSVLTFVVLFGIYLAAVPLYHWGIGEAVWEAASRRECLDRSPGGACWAGVLDWSTRFIYGRYP
ncbi:MAG: amino acid ABC transporter permease, partial [Rhodospirillaceae bacterium]|nr:amino acid ABC transporter permease [Rhodospirillaceae bacterium]